MRAIRWGSAALGLMLLHHTAAAQDSAGSVLDLQFARHLYAQGEYRLAADEFSRFVRRYPDSVDAEQAAFLAADCWVQLGDWGRARAGLEAFLVDHPVSHWADEARQRLGAALLELGEYVAAERTYVLIAEGGAAGAAEALYWAGEAAFRRNDFPRAAELLAQASGRLASGEIRGWALRRRAEALQRMGRDEAARGILGELAQGSSAQPEDLLSLAGLLIEAGRPGEARAALQTLARRWPDRADSRLARELTARSLWDQHARGDAIAVLLDHPGENPRLLGWMLLQDHRPAEAVRILQPAMRSLEGRDRSEAVLMLASALRGMERPSTGDSVLAVETAGITDRAMLSSAIVLRASLQVELGEYEGARRVLDRGFKHVSTRWDSVEAWRLYAEIETVAGRWDEASRYYLKASGLATESVAVDLALRSLVAAYRAEAWDQVERLAGSFRGDPTDSMVARAVFWKAEALSRQGRWSEADSAYLAAVPGLPTAREKSQAAFGRAWSLFALGRLDDARAGFGDVVRLDPGSEMAARARVRAGNVLMFQGRYLEAAGEFRAASQLVAHRVVGDDALLGLGRALSLAGRTDEAAQVLENLFEASPTAAIADDALFEKGEALFRAGRFDDAEAEYRRVIDLQRDRDLRDNAFYRVGDCQYNRGEYPSARITYLSVVLGYPESDLWPHAVQGALWAELQSAGAERAVALCDSLHARVSNEERRVALVRAKADLLYGLERFDDAFTLYRNLDEPDADLRAAWCLEKAGRLSDARAAFEELARRRPSLPQAAEGLYQAGRLARGPEPMAAVHLLTALLSQYPSSDLRDAARFELGAALAAVNPDSALGVWATLARTGSSEWREKAMVAIAQVHLEAGRPESTMAWLPALLDHPSTSSGPQAHWLAAEASLATGDSTEARRFFLRLTYLFPEDSLAAPATASANALARRRRSETP